MYALSKQDNKISLQSSGIPTIFQSNPFAKGGLIKLWKSNIHEWLKGFITSFRRLYGTFHQVEQFQIRDL
jgi:hypothetical protein